jgi:hypothetical protein
MIQPALIILRCAWLVRHVIAAYFHVRQNIQSTNWQTLRLKPPPPGTSIGWRVEFRSMEIQVTDYENAAFALFVVLLSRAILKFELNMYMPISKVTLLARFFPACVLKALHDVG